MATHSDILLYGPTFSYYTGFYILINYLQKREVAVPSTANQVGPITTVANCFLTCAVYAYCPCCLFFSACAVHLSACAVHFLACAVYFFCLCFSALFSSLCPTFHLGPTSHLSQVYRAKRHPSAKIT